MFPTEPPEPRLITSTVCPALAARPPIAAAIPPDPMMLIVRMCSLLVSWVVNLRIVSCGIGLDGSGPGARVRLGGPRQCLRVDILPDVRQFAISNGNGEDPMVLELPVRGFDSPRSEADDQNPVSPRYELGGLWVRSFHRFVSLLK